MHTTDLGRCELVMIEGIGLLCFGFLMGRLFQRATVERFDNWLAGHKR